MLNRVYIDLNILRENAINVKKSLPVTVKLCAVVKADAYGHGAIPVANAIYNIADCYAVALVEEGIKLRQGGIDKDILVLIPIAYQDVFNVVFYGMTVAVDSVEQVLALENECARQEKSVRVHVKFNSGMNRLGVDGLEELDVLLGVISKCKWVKLDGMFSHFSRPEKKKSLISQQNKFLLANNLVKRYNNKVTCHISASGGFINGAFFDMVRIGILLYGYKPFATEKISVSPVMKIYAPIVKTRKLKRGERALYGDKKSKRDGVFDLVRYGYADGMDRNGGRFADFNRCMDLSLFKSDGKEKDFVCILADAEKIAKDNRTISYEILTKSAMRAEKIYLN